MTPDPENTALKELADNVDEAKRLIFEATDPNFTWMCPCCKQITTHPDKIWLQLSDIRVAANPDRRFSDHVLMIGFWELVRDQVLELSSRFEIRRKSSD